MGALITHVCTCTGHRHQHTKYWLTDISSAQRSTWPGSSCITRCHPREEHLLSRRRCCCSARGCAAAGAREAAARWRCQVPPESGDKSATSSNQPGTSTTVLIRHLCLQAGPLGRPTAAQLCAHHGSCLKLCVEPTFAASAQGYLSGLLSISFSVNSSAALSSNTLP